MDTEEKTLYPMRINKYLASRAISTRKGADELIKEGKVFINGKRAELGSKINEKDNVEVKGNKNKEYLYVAYNKPIGIETGSPKNVLQKGLFPLGRLDKASHGLLILTNDGRITDRLLNPKYIHDKEYVVKTSNKLRSSFKQKMEAGVNIEAKGKSEKTKKCQVKIINDFTFNIILTEGKKHQIRRMCSALFQEIADLKRIRIMNIKLDNLKPNAVREIKGAELTTFLDQVLHQS